MKKGFTLIELVVCCIVVFLLAGIFKGVLDKAKMNKNKNNSINVTEDRSNHNMNVNKEN